jgi:hypothetical protein
MLMKGQQDNEGFIRSIGNRAAIVCLCVMMLVPRSRKC